MAEEIEEIVGWEDPRYKSSVGQRVGTCTRIALAQGSQSFFGTVLPY